MEADGTIRVKAAGVLEAKMATLATLIKLISLGILVLAASLIVGGLYQSVAVSNGNQAGDIYLFNRFTGAYYVCRNKVCAPGKFSN